MRIVIFGGTTEGRELSRLLSRWGAEVTVSVATEYGREAQGECPGVKVVSGRRNQSQMEELVRGAALCVDATHPYAAEASAAIHGACEAAGVPRLRLLREAGADYADSTSGTGSGGGEASPGAEISPSLSGDSAKASPGGGVDSGTVLVDSAADAAAYLLDKPGNVLLATGSKELPCFAALDPARLFPRVLPSHEALNICERLHIPHRNVIAMQGPFSRALNEAMLRQVRAAYLVTKDGGPAGGFPEKAAAARNTGAVLLVIRRPADDGVSYGEAAAFCRRLLGLTDECT